MRRAATVAGTSLTEQDRVVAVTRGQASQDAISTIRRSRDGGGDEAPIPQTLQG